MRARRNETLDRFVDARVLVVAESARASGELARGLRAFGYSICGTPRSRDEAVARAAEATPDLILIDLRTTERRRGLELARAIRERTDAPVVFLCARDDSAMLSRSARLGPFAHIAEPFDERTLHITLMMAMCKHRALAALRQDEDDEQTMRVRGVTPVDAQLESLTELGAFALRTAGPHGVLHRAVALARVTLGVGTVGIFELSEDGESFFLRSGTGWADGAVGSARLDASPVELLGRTLIAPGPVVVDAHTDTSDPVTPVLFAQHELRSTIAVLIPARTPRDRYFGVLTAHSRSQRDFSREEVEFLQAMAHVVAGAVQRADIESQLVEAERAAESARARATRAEAAIAARDELLSVAAHELRSPVAALQLQLEALEELLDPRRRPVSQRVTRKLERAARTVTRLTKLVETVLDVSRAGLGRLDLDREPLDLAAVAREVVARHEELARSADCPLRLTTDGTAQGRWDRTRLDQVITNLLSNALKFGAGRPIDVRVESDASGTRLSVRDRGPGLEPAQAERLMNRFEQAVSHRSYGGLGLGLYISRRIVEAHGGRLTMKSAPGRGAHFMVSLPHEPETATAAATDR